MDMLGAKAACEVSMRTSEGEHKGNHIGQATAAGVCAVDEGVVPVTVFTLMVGFLNSGR